MSVSIRLRREGAKNRPYYKVVVADRRSPRDGKFIEMIGTYDPKMNGENSTIKIDRAEHWIARGAQASDTVRSLLKKSKARAVGVANEAGELTPASTKAAPAKQARAKGRPDLATETSSAPAATPPEDSAAAPAAVDEPVSPREPAAE